MQTRSCSAYCRPRLFPHANTRILITRKRYQTLGKRLRILAIGAHPDDCDIKCGGSAILWAAAGHSVTFVSLTNGDAGHQTLGRDELAARRAAEAEAAAQVAGIDSYEVHATHDGALEATMARREDVIRLIRRHQPDLIITHRTNDYHPDHRYETYPVPPPQSTAHFIGLLVAFLKLPLGTCELVL